MLIVFVVAAVSALGLLLVALVNPAVAMRTKMAFTGFAILGVACMAGITLIPGKQVELNKMVYNERPDLNVKNHTFEKQNIALDNRNFSSLTRWGDVDIADPATYSKHENFDALRKMHRGKSGEVETKGVRDLMNSTAPSKGERVYIVPSSEWSEVRIVERDNKIMLVRKRVDTPSAVMVARIDAALSRYDLNPVMKADPEYEFGRLISFNDHGGEEVAIVLITREGNIYQELVKIDMKVIERARSLRGIDL